MKRKVAKILVVWGVILVSVMGSNLAMAVGGSATPGTNNANNSNTNSASGGKSSVEGKRIKEKAGTGCAKSFLGFRPWYQSLQKEDCELGTPQNLPAYVWTIILNVLVDLFVALGYTAIGFIIWAGFKYIMSGGDPGKVAQAKKMIISAVIGVVIALAAGVITDTIIKVIGG